MPLGQHSVLRLPRGSPQAWGGLGETSGEGPSAQWPRASVAWRGGSSAWIPPCPRDTQGQRANSSGWRVSGLGPWSLTIVTPGLTKPSFQSLNPQDQLDFVTVQSSPFQLTRHVELPVVTSGELSSGLVLRGPNRRYTSPSSAISQPCDPGLTCSPICKMGILLFASQR